MPPSELSVAELDRQAERYERQIGREIGFVASWDKTKGFGRIDYASGRAGIHVHISALASSGYSYLDKGTKVSFCVVNSSSKHSGGKELKMAWSITVLPSNILDVVNSRRSGSASPGSPMFEPRDANFLHASLRDQLIATTRSVNVLDSVVTKRLDVESSFVHRVDLLDSVFEKLKAAENRMAAVEKTLEAARASLPVDL